MVPVFQQPTDLVLGVCRTPAIPVRLQVLAMQRWQLRDIEVTFRIIGESHWISVQRCGAPVLHELLACVPLPNATCMFHHAFQATTSCRYQIEDYTVAVTFQPFAEHHQQLGSDHDNIEIQFPHPLGHAQLPFTRIWWRTRDDCLQWWTLHTYINDQAAIAVVSESRYFVPIDEHRLLQNNQMPWQRRALSEKGTLQCHGSLPLQ